MLIIKDLTSNNFIKIDKKAFEVLSNNAVIVYITFAKIHPNVDPQDPFMAPVARMSINTYKNAKAELVKHGYLYVQRHGAKGAKITYHFGKNAVDSIKDILSKKEKKTF